MQSQKRACEDALAPETAPSDSARKRTKTESSQSTLQPTADAFTPNINNTKTVFGVVTRPVPPKIDSLPMTYRQKAFLIEKMKNTKKIKSAFWFIRPVDYVALRIPDYPNVIKQPMDLTSMEAKLKKGDYESVDDLVADFELMINNAILFSGIDHASTVSGQNIRAYFHKHMQMCPDRGRETLQKTSSKFSEIGKKRKLANPELSFCEHVLEEFRKSKYDRYTAPFRVPVDPIALKTPNYFAVIKQPMDISTITQRLRGGHYTSALDFKQDFDLIFQNCFCFSPPHDTVHQLGRGLEASFAHVWSMKDIWIKNHAPVLPGQAETRNDKIAVRNTSSASDFDDTLASKAAAVALLRSIALLMQNTVASTRSPRSTPNTVAAKQSNKSLTTDEQPKKSKIVRLKIAQKDKLQEILNHVPAKQTDVTSVETVTSPATSLKRPSLISFGPEILRNEPAPKQTVVTPPKPENPDTKIARLKKIIADAQAEIASSEETKKLQEEYQKLSVARKNADQQIGFTVRKHKKLQKELEDLKNETFAVGAELEGLVAKRVGIIAEQNAIKRRIGEMDESKEEATT